MSQAGKPRFNRFYDLLVTIPLTAILTTQVPRLTASSEDGHTQATLKVLKPLVDSAKGDIAAELGIGKQTATAMTATESGQKEGDKRGWWLSADNVLNDTATHETVQHYLPRGEHEIEKVSEMNLAVWLGLVGKHIGSKMLQDARSKIAKSLIAAEFNSGAALMAMTMGDLLAVTVSIDLKRGVARQVIHAIRKSRGERMSSEPHSTGVLRGGTGVTVESQLNIKVKKTEDADGKQTNATKLNNAAQTKKAKRDQEVEKKKAQEKQDAEKKKAQEQQFLIDIGYKPDDPNRIAGEEEMIAWLVEGKMRGIEDKVGGAGHGSERNKEKFFSGGELLTCWFQIMKSWKKRKVPTWTTHGTSLAVLRGEATPWDGDADVAIMIEDHEEVNNIFGYYKTNGTDGTTYTITEANGKRDNYTFSDAIFKQYQLDFVACKNMKIDWIPHVGGIHGIMNEKYKHNTLDVWKFSSHIDGMTEVETQKIWNATLNVTPDSKLRCKWICVLEADILPLRSCNLSVPIGDSKYGPVMRVEHLEVPCGNRFEESWAKHFPPYESWDTRIPYNLYDSNKHVWKFDIPVWRNYVQNGGSGSASRIIYDTDESGRVLERAAAKLRTMLKDPAQTITPPTNVTHYVYE